MIQLVQKVLLVLWSDHTLGYKTQHSFGAIIEPLTTQATTQTTQTTLNIFLNMSMLSSVQYCLAKGLTIPVLLWFVLFAIREALDHTPLPKRLLGAHAVASIADKFVDCWDCCRSCHRGGIQQLPSWHGPR